MCEILTLFHKESNSTVDQDTLFHGESLFVIASSDSENVAFVLISEDFSIDFLTHSSIEEMATIADDKIMG